MSPCCGKMPNADDVKHIRSSIEDAFTEREAIEFFITTLARSLSHDLSVSNSADPFTDPVSTQKNSNEWTTSKGNHIVARYSPTTNQLNIKIVEGPDRGMHRFFNYDTLHQGQTGVENFREGHEGERKP